MNELHPEYAYLDIAKQIMQYGWKTDDRTGTGTYSLFGTTLNFNLSPNILPVLTSKKVHLPSVIHELLWFLSGDTNIQYLKDNKVRIWNEWADENGDLGPVYGRQWRDYNGSGIDQIANAIDLINNDPESRRIIVNAWNPQEIEDAALPPCHSFFQFKVYLKGDKKYLSCLMYQRSADWFLGVPFNIASYALLTHMIAHVTGCIPYNLHLRFGDSHVYDNHFQQMDFQVNRAFTNHLPDFPTIWLNPDVKNIDDFKFEDIEVIGYDHFSPIKAQVSV